MKTIQKQWIQRKLKNPDHKSFRFMIGKKAVGTVEGHRGGYQINGQEIWHFRGKSLVISTKQTSSCSEKDIPKTVLFLKSYVEEKWDEFMEKTGIIYP